MRYLWSRCDDVLVVVGHGFRWVDQLRRIAGIPAVWHPGTQEHPRRLISVAEDIRRHHAPCIVYTTLPHLLDFFEPEEILVTTESAACLMSDALHAEERLSQQLTGEMWFNVGEDALVGLTEEDLARPGVFCWGPEMLEGEEEKP